jgi:septal ring factor EnvC (AmiA/AmiB activator)
MDKREAGFRREEINQELAALWAKVGECQEELMKLTTQGKEQNWTMAEYQVQRAPLMARKMALGDEIKQLTAELEAVDAILGI